MANNVYDDGRRAADPLPNILRVETLSEAALKEYLTVYGRISQDLQHGLRTREKSALKELDFYGFMQNDSITIGITPTWQGGSSSSMLDYLGSKPMAKKKDDKGTLGSKLVTTVAGIGDLGARGLTSEVTRLFGANATATGVSTQKHFSGLSLGPQTISCGWYLPQSLKQAVIGLKTILEMAYPQSVSSSQTITRGLEDSLVSGVDNFVEGATGFLTSVLSAKKADFESLRDIVDSTVASVPGMNGALEDFVGVTLTFDPRPVRVSIGNKAVLEPMVINNLTIRMSKESFLKSYATKKKLLPEFVMVEIGFEYWMVPAPLKNKTKLLGLPMFSTVTPDGKSNQRSMLSDEAFSDVFNDSEG